MKFVGTIYKGAKPDDFETFRKLPEELSSFMEQVNGATILFGGFTFKGCLHTPKWLSLREVWMGEYALYKTYPSLTENDIPFGQDVFGDQYILRERIVFRLLAEQGILESYQCSLPVFLKEVENNPFDFLQLTSFKELMDSGVKANPGQLLNIYPPFMFNSDIPRSYRLISAEEQISFLKNLYLKTKNLPDGVPVDFKVLLK